MLIEAGRLGLAKVAAEVALLLTERGLGGNDPDLETRLRRWRSDRSPRSASARKMADRLSAAVQSGAEEAFGGGHDIARAVALAFPDRVSKRRSSTGESWQSVGGRGFRLDPASSLASSPWLAVAEVAGHASGARVLSAAALSEEEVLALFGDRVEVRREAAFDMASGGVSPTRSRRWGAVQLSSGPDPQPDLDIIEKALMDGVRTHGLHLLPWSSGCEQLRKRAQFAHTFDPAIPNMDDAALMEALDEWLPALVGGKRRLADIDTAALRSAIEQLIGYPQMRAVERLAPMDFVSPAGSRHAIDYSATGGPIVEVRAQALFGLSMHPMVGGGAVPLTLAITSPAGRPIQTTRDLPGFWRGSWRDVAREMRGRYPRHPWPDDPASAPPTLRTKRADQRNQ